MWSVTVALLKQGITAQSFILCTTVSLAAPGLAWSARFLVHRLLQHAAPSPATHCWKAPVKDEDAGESEEHGTL